MSQEFKLHKQAVMMECYLNEIMKKGSEEYRYGEADITMIYDAPIKVIIRMLHSLPKKNVKFKEKVSDIKRKYGMMDNTLLLELEHDMILALCEDLKTLSKEKL